MVAFEALPEQVLSDPVLLFLYHRAEQILGIRAAPEALVKLKVYLEERCGASYLDAPAEYERILSSREDIFTLAGILTVNETYFFREEPHFNLLMRYFLPRLAKLGRLIRVCSAATSTGCEAYSLAMLMDFYGRGRDLGALDGEGGDAQSFSFEIDAFDIDRSVIEIARHGRYNGNARREDGAGWDAVLDAYLIRDGDEFEVPAAIRKKVRFFTHNIMDGLEGRYDIIFFRNAMIYFSPENRRRLMDILAGALVDNGILFLGISETSSVEHPLLVNKYTMETFYFQRLGIKRDATALSIRGEGRKAAVEAAPALKTPSGKLQRMEPPADAARVQPGKAASKRAGYAAGDIPGIAAILEYEEGGPNARKVLEALRKTQGGGDLLSVNEMIAAAIYFLGAGDFSAADMVLSCLETKRRSVFTDFLRGEYHYLGNKTGEAETKYKEAADNDKAFWPAFYRMSFLAAEGNRTLYEYKIKRALESIELGKDLHYESFIGGFSPDYYRQILERKLAPGIV